MKVQNMISPNNNRVSNQFIITNEIEFIGEDNQKKIGSETIMQSYDSIIVKKIEKGWDREVLLDEFYWNYSKTTSKYRNIFLGETTKETERKIKEGVYKLVNLN